MYIDIVLHEKDELGRNDKFYVQTVSKEVTEPEKYLEIKYNGKGASLGNHRIRFTDADGNDLNLQQYYEPVDETFTSKLVFDEMTNPLLQKMVASLSSVFSSPQSKAMMLAAGAIVVVVMVLTFVG